MYNVICSECGKIYLNAVNGEEATLAERNGQCQCTSTQFYKVEVEKRFFCSYCWAELKEENGFVDQCECMNVDYVTMLLSGR